ncbi:AAA domain-containing protein [Gemmiger sp.]
MNTVTQCIFRAIHEGKWLSIEYRNQQTQLTKYWIAVRGVDPKTRVLSVDGLHLSKLSVQALDHISVDRIQSAGVVDGSWCAVNQQLVDDIRDRPARYEALFGNAANLRVLDYLAACNRLDATPCRTNYSLIQGIDADRFAEREADTLPLTDAQFRMLVQRFQRRVDDREKGAARPRLPELGLNLISIPTGRGLYVLAYRPLRLDVKNRALRAEAEPVICREFTVNGSKLSIHRFLDADDAALLDDFYKNQETIKDRITRENPHLRGVDDMPYLVAIDRDCPVDLEHEYRGITDMFEDPSGETVTAPLRAFFGEMTAKPRRRKSYPLALLNNKVNLDQLLAINNAMRYPLAYVQGPPGTGKTNTIVNTLTTAFFNERTVLFASYNNHPIDGVVEKLQHIDYHGQTVPFPILRLGNNEKTEEALRTIDKLYEQCRKLPVPETLLDKNHADRTARAARLTELLERYEVILDLQERKETIQRLLDARGQMNFQYELQAGQLPQVNRELAACGTITTADALALLDRNENELLRYLYYTSVRYIRRLEEPKYEELMAIVHSPDTEKERVARFNKYISEPENLKKLLRVFPIIATTCISAHRLGEPEPSFDMTIMDEAGQCNTAMSLVPILRGRSLMLVGDPQQLSPVIVLDPADNRTLRRRYGVTQEYDYIENSIYKCFLACDAVSDETLLSYHYRCSPKIIEFNNRKYYNHRLHIASAETHPRPLIYVDVPDDTTDERNTAPEEVRCIEQFLRDNPERQVGIITPFARQRAAIEKMLQANHWENATCGTVHAFQGDEKDVVIFSLALTDRTHAKTYEWLRSNKELINVATSRAREQLVVISNRKELERLHAGGEGDDIYELVQYVRSNGFSEVTEKPAASRALGIKPYSAKTEEAFLANLNHALDNAFLDGSRCTVRNNVPAAQVLDGEGETFGNARFDFVVYQKENRDLRPILAIELGGQERRDNIAAKKRARAKASLCREHGFELIFVENTYARRYNYIKGILRGYFRKGA